MPFTDDRTELVFSWLLKNHGGMCQEIRSGAGTAGLITAQRIKKLVWQAFAFGGGNSDPSSNPFAQIVTEELEKLDYEEMATALSTNEQTDAWEKHLENY